MVEPQSPLYNVRRYPEYPQCYLPEVGDDFVSGVSLLLVLLWGSLCNLERILRVDLVAGVGCASDLSAIEAMAKNLSCLLALTKRAYTGTYVGLGVARDLIADAAANTSSGRHDVRWGIKY